ncbi:hypothetical protein AURDEDRAFT_158727 [Auricularia subglabra TFB-10046 SS5]|nr:hypothetical protein AURDEDRAFT_158727 [Auricularia subglabra TFB-10046 SS5]
MQRRLCRKPAHMLITPISSFHADKPASHHKGESESVKAQEDDASPTTSADPGPTESSSSASASASETTSASESDKSSAQPADASTMSEAAAAPTSSSSDAAPDETKTASAEDSAETVNTTSDDSPGVFNPSAQHAMKIVSPAASLSSTTSPTEQSTASSKEQSAVSPATPSSPPSESTSTSVRSTSTPAAGAFLAAAQDGQASTTSPTVSVSVETVLLSSAAGSVPASSAAAFSAEAASTTPVDLENLTPSLTSAGAPPFSLQTALGAVITPLATDSTSATDSVSVTDSASATDSTSVTDQSTAPTASSTAFDIASFLGADNVASTVISQGPSQTITIMGYTDSSGFTPVYTRTGPASIAVSPVTSKPAKIWRASRTPVIVIISVVVFVTIACIVISIFLFCRKLRRMRAFDEDNMTELGFPPDYNPFMDGFRDQEKAMGAARKSGDQADSDRSPLPGEIPAYFMKDNPAHLRVANYVQGDVSDSSAASPGLSPRPWRPLEPRKSILKTPKVGGVEVSKEVVVGMPGDKYTPVPRRPSRKIKPSEIPKDGKDQPLPPLNKVVREYYAANPEHAPSAHVSADSLDSDKTAMEESAYAGMVVKGDSGDSGVELGRSKSATSSLYSNGSHELPPISLTDTSMSSLKHALTGFQVISDDEQSLAPSRGPGLRRALSLQSSSADSSTSEDYAGSDYERLNDGITREERAVRKVLRERRKKSLALRAGLGDHSLHRSYTRLTLLQRK